MAVSQNSILGVCITRNANFGLANFGLPQFASPEEGEHFLIPGRSNHSMAISDPPGGVAGDLAFLLALTAHAAGFCSLAC